MEHGGELRIVLQTLHILAGVIWAGGQLLFALAILPALRGLPPRRSQEILGSLGARVGPLMAASGSATILLGVARAVWVGPVRSLSVLVGTTYGIALIVALALGIAASIHGARSEVRYAALFQGDAWHPDAPRRIRADMALVLALVVGLLGSMSVMRFGI